MRVTLDGMKLPGDTFTGVHVASMSINLGDVFRFFGQADQQGLMNAIVGTPSPWSIVRNIPRMARGEEMIGRNILDRPCREMILEATGDELLAPIIDGEYYRDVKQLDVSRRAARADPESRRRQARRRVAERDRSIFGPSAARIESPQGEARSAKAEAPSQVSHLQLTVAGPPPSMPHVFGAAHFAILHARVLRLEAAPAEHVEAVAAIALVAPRAPLAVVDRIAVGDRLAPLLFLRRRRLVRIDLRPAAGTERDPGHDRERESLGHPPRRHRRDHAIVGAVAEDDRALMERLAVLEAEVKADADAQSARKEAAQAKAARAKKRRKTPSARPNVARSHCRPRGPQRRVGQAPARAPGRRR